MVGGRLRGTKGNRKAMAPVGVHDVAAYILQKLGPVSAVKLQKLVYYSQAWSLVWDDRPLFPEPIEAWSAGPVVPALYRAHRGQFLVHGSAIGAADRLDARACATIDAVIAHYGSKDAQWLSDLTHLEDPWRKARPGLPDGMPSNAVITLASMAEYYGTLPPSAANI